MAQLRDILNRSAIRHDNNEHRYHSEDRSLAGATQQNAKQERRRRCQDNEHYPDASLRLPHVRPHQWTNHSRQVSVRAFCVCVCVVFVEERWMY